MHHHMLNFKCRYGYVTPDDVPELLDQHIAKGEIIQRIWRYRFQTHDLLVWVTYIYSDIQNSNICFFFLFQGTNGLTRRCN